MEYNPDINVRMGDMHVDSSVGKKKLQRYNGLEIQSLRHHTLSSVLLMRHL